MHIVFKLTLSYQRSKKRGSRLNPLSMLRPEKTNPCLSYALQKEEVALKKLLFKYLIKYG